MQRIIFISAIFIFLSTACHQQQDGKKGTVKRDIPTDIFGDADIFYHLAKQRQSQLGLDSLENGFSKLQVRLWYNNLSSNEQKLVVVTNRDSNWMATIYHLQVERDGNTENILSKKISNVTPVTGWDAFSKKLQQLPVLTLPNQDDVEGYSAGENGITYSVEAATGDQYRFYSYWEPGKNKDRFLQAKNMWDIVQLLETAWGN